MKKEYRKLNFAIEDGQVFEGYQPVDLSNEPFRGYWNGWLCPYVDAKTHDKICAYLMDNLDSFDAIPSEYDDLKSFIDAKPNKDGLYYWGGCYIWSEVKKNYFEEEY
tara:strand:+ start:84 stop:404 length:321 start_codon:yes stop_codon:yes gene_type:complete